MEADNPASGQKDHGSTALVSPDPVVTRLDDEKNGPTIRTEVDPKDSKDISSKPIDMASEFENMKAALSAMMEKQAILEAEAKQVQDAFSFPEEHQLDLRRRRYNNDSSDSDSDAYTKFDQRRRQMERVFVRELKVLGKEKELVQTIRQLERELGDYKEKEQTWEKERTKLRRFQRQLRQDKHFKRDEISSIPTQEDTPEPTVPEAPPPAAGKAEETDAVPSTPPVYTVPKLRYVQWSEFKDRSDYAEDELYSIDVLKGEPVITFDSTSSRSRKKYGFSHRKGDELGKGAGSGNAKKKQALLPGQALLPERIRINSKQIIKALEQISGETLTSHDDSLVMIRPFKFLDHYEDRIRQMFHGDTDKSEKASGVVDNDAVTAEATDPASDKVDQNNISDKREEKSDDGTPSYVVRQQLGCLVEFMDTEIQGKVKYLESDACDRVSFTDLWYLFKPGDEVIDQNRKQAYRVIEVSNVSHKVVPPWRNYFYDTSSTKSEQTPIFLHCVYVDFDGKDIGPVSKVFEIPRFDGDRVVTSLDVYPLRYAEGGEVPEKTFREKLVTRGKMFLDVASVSHMHYNGLTLDARDEVDSQVVVDFEESFAAKGNAEWRPKVERLIGTSKLPRVDNDICTAECCRDENVYKDTEVEAQRNRDYIESLIPEDRNRYPSVAVYPRALKDTKSPENGLADDEFVIMSYRVFGFILRSRKWAQLDLTFLHQINSNISTSAINEHDDNDKGEGKKIEKQETASKEHDNNENGEEKKTEKQETAFDQLVLPPGHKKMVLSLIAQHFRDKESKSADTEQVDIVRGKGKGLIILLHGAPGVGKTTTAEGVAEMFRKPLFQITCGDLGTTAGEVEAELEKNFALANRWGCILLLDEADVFLTTRSPQDFKRNGLVAVFLRVLEYYAGILFLTTNRIGDFDEAFASRIHISLYYPPLDLVSTLEVFKLNLKLIRNRFSQKGRELTIDEKEILDFAERYWSSNEKMRWNGRQIRNGCQTALALAEFDAQGGSHERIKDANAKVKLQFEHLKIVSEAYIDFISYLTKIYGKDADRRAKAMNIRAREADAKKEDRTVEGTALGSSNHQTTGSSSQNIFIPSAQPSPTPQPGYPTHPPQAPLQQSNYPYSLFQQQPGSQLLQQSSQPGTGAFMPQAMNQMPNAGLSGQPQAPWPNLNASQWPGAYQQIPGQIPGQMPGQMPGQNPGQLPGQNPYGGAPPFGWAPGPSQQDPVRDQPQSGGAPPNPPR